MSSQSTQLTYSRDGKYLPKRRVLHRKIVGKILEGVERQQEPEIVFMGGGTAVGKSTVREIYVQRYNAHSTIAVIDCDDIKEQIPDYALFKTLDKKTAASLVHAESGDIAMQALEVALKRRMHIIFDGTMKDHDWYAQLINKVKAMGYIAIACVVYAPLEVAIQREAVRAEKTERVVPPEELKRSHALVKDSFVTLKPLFDAYSLWDNSRNDFSDPIPFEEILPGMEEPGVYDWTTYLEFYSS
jgi:predicted ABC-type ATPase